MRVFDHPVRCGTQDLSRHRDISVTNMDYGRILFQTNYGTWAQEMNWNETVLCSAKLFVWRPAHHEDDLVNFASVRVYPRI